MYASGSDALAPNLREIWDRPSLMGAHRLGPDGARSDASAPLKRAKPGTGTEGEEIARSSSAGAPPGTQGLSPRSNAETTTSEATMPPAVTASRALGLPEPPPTLAVTAPGPDPLRSMDLPQWIEALGVDSAAMPSAFLQYRSTCKGESLTQIGDLYIIEHRASPILLVTGMTLEVDVPPWGKVRPGIPRFACRAVGCIRCSEERGGYQFKWYHRRWREAYDGLRREGSLSAADLEAM